MPKRGVQTDLLDKRRRAVEMRNSGLTYQAIADALGYATHVGARKAVLTGLREAIREPAEEVVEREVARLDALLLGLLDQACGGDLGAVHGVLKIMDRRAKYLGLDTFNLNVTTRDGDVADLDAALDQWAAATPTRGPGSLEADRPS